MALDHRTKSVWPTFIWALLAFCLLGVVSIVGVRLFGGEQKEYDVTRAKERLENRQKLEKEEHALLDQYSWVDKEKGLVRLPLPRAMEVALAELKQKPVAASGVLVTPPAPAVDAAPAADAASPDPAAADGAGTAAPNVTVPPAAP